MLRRMAKRPRIGLFTILSRRVFKRPKGCRSGMKSSLTVVHRFFLVNMCHERMNINNIQFPSLRVSLLSPHPASISAFSSDIFVALSCPCHRTDVDNDLCHVVQVSRAGPLGHDRHRHPRRRLQPQQ